MRHLIGIVVTCAVILLLHGGCVLGPQPEPPDVNEESADAPAGGRCDDAYYDEGSEDEMSGYACDPALAGEDDYCDGAVIDGDGDNDHDRQDPDEEPPPGWHWEPVFPDDLVAQVPYDPTDPEDSDGDGDLVTTADPDDYYAADSDRDGVDDDDDDEDDDDLLIVVQ